MTDYCFYCKKKIRWFNRRKHWWRQCRYLFMKREEQKWKELASDCDYGGLWSGNRPYNCDHPKRPKRNLDVLVFCNVLNCPRKKEWDIKWGEL